MQYQLVATLGPATSSEWLWDKLLETGSNVFRLNTSHLSLEQLTSWIEQLGAFFDRRSQAVPVVLDLQGSKWRLGQFQPVYLEKGQKITLVNAVSAENPGHLPVPHTDFFQASFFSGREILLSDAKVCLEMETAGNEAIQAVVSRGGEISARKGITYANSNFRIERLSDKDQKIIETTLSLPFVRYAVSYVKDGIEMQRYRHQFRSIHHQKTGDEQKGGGAPYLIAKLERQPAIDEVDQVAEFADEIWLCRGDMGAELGIRSMAETVHHFSRRLKEIKIPVQLAGQVLEHMTLNPSPTRSEVCYLYDILRMGYAGVVLSDETAIGKYPVESVAAAGLFRSKDL